MIPSETALGFALLRCKCGPQIHQGTLFLTTRRLIWRSFETGAEAPWFEVALEDLLAVGRVSGVHDRPGAFALRMQRGGNVESVEFYAWPERSRASVRSAETMFRNIRSQRKAPRSGTAFRAKAG